MSAEWGIFAKIYPRIEGCHPILALKLLNSLILTQIIQHIVYNCVASIQMGHETDNRGSLVIGGNEGFNPDLAPCLVIDGENVQLWHKFA